MLTANNNLSWKVRKHCIVFANWFPKTRIWISHYMCLDFQTHLISSVLYRGIKGHSYVPIEARQLVYYLMHNWWVWELSEEALHSVKEVMSRYFSIFLKSKVSSHQLNSKNNGLALLLMTTLHHWKCFLSSVATEGKDRNGLKLEKIGFLMLCSQKSPKNYG